MKLDKLIEAHVEATRIKIIDISLRFLPKISFFLEKKKVEIRTRYTKFGSKDPFNLMGNNVGTFEIYHVPEDDGDFNIQTKFILNVPEELK